MINTDKNVSDITKGITFGDYADVRIPLKYKYYFEWFSTQFINRFTPVIPSVVHNMSLRKKQNYCAACFCAFYGLPLDLDLIPAEIMSEVAAINNSEQILETSIAFAVAETLTSKT